MLKKNAEVGAHVLSGAIFEPRGLDKVIPNWKEFDAPVTTAVTKDKISTFANLGVGDSNFSAGLFV